MHDRDIFKRHICLEGIGLISKGFMFTVNALAGISIATATRTNLRPINVRPFLVQVSQGQDMEAKTETELKIKSNIDHQIEQVWSDLLHDHLSR